MRFAVLTGVRIEITFFWAMMPDFSSQKQYGFFSCPECPHRLWGSPTHLSKGLWSVKLGSHSPPSSGDVQNAWRYTSTDQCPCFHGLVHKHNFSLCYFYGFIQNSFGPVCISLTTSAPSWARWLSKKDGKSSASLWLYLVFLMLINLILFHISINVIKYFFNCNVT